MTVSIPSEHFYRMLTGLNDSLGETDPTFDRYQSYFYEVSQRIESEFVYLNDVEVEMLCEMYAIELEMYAEVLRDLSEKNLDEYVVILDYIEELACICEGIQYLMTNKDFNRHFYDLKRSLEDQYRKAKK